MDTTKSLARMGRRLHRVITSRRAWALAFQGLQAIAATSLMAIILWAAFFTRIPEALLRQGRSDTADSSGQPASLVQGERAFLGEVQAAQVALTEAEGKLLEAERALQNWQYRLEALQMDIAALSEQRAGLSAEKAAALKELSEIRAQIRLVEGQLGKALVERDAYLGIPFGKATEQLLQSLLKAFNEQSRQMRNALLLQRLPEFAARQKELERQLTWMAGLATRSEIESAWRERYAEDAEWTLWRTGDDNIPRQRASLRQALITAAGDQPPTGEEIVLGILQRESFGYLLDRDWAILDATVRSAVAKHHDLLLLPLRITLYNNFTDDDLAREIDRAQKAMNDMQRFMTLLRETLVADVGEAR